MTDLSQAEADDLIALPKQREDTREWDYPVLGGKISIPLVSLDHREKFVLDLSRGRINLAKGTYQNRGRGVVILARLDFGGAPHRNPNGEEVASPHLHVYREGFGDKWAFPAPRETFTDLSDLWQTLQDFMRYCNVVEQPMFQKGLFS